MDMVKVGYVKNILERGKADVRKAGDTHSEKSQGRRVFSHCDVQALGREVSYQLVASNHGYMFLSEY